MDHRDFYTELGKLLYAVADADGVISQAEKDELVDLIRTRMTHKEIHTDEFGTNDAWYAAFEFDVAEEQILSPEDALQSFTDYLMENRNNLDLETREFCLLLADRLAGSFHQINRKEKEMIQKIKEILFDLENMPEAEAAVNSVKKTL
jgi:uncharacterized tellurite resistance protein B-like protein